MDTPLLFLFLISCCCCSVTKSYWTLHDRIDCSMPGFPVLHHLPVCPSSCPLNQWCHPTISSSVAPFSFCLHSFPASGSFPMSWVFPSGSQSIGASASVLPMNIQGWFSLRLNSLIFLLSKGLSRVFSSTTVLRHSAFFIVQLSYLYMTTGKAIPLTIWTFVSKVIYLLFNTLSRSVIAFLPRSNQLLVSCL